MVAWHSPQHHLRDIWSNGYSRRRRRVRASIRMRRAGDCGLLTTHHWARVACGAATVARLACWHAPGTGGLHAAPEAPEPGADPQLQAGTDLAGYEIGLKRSAVHEANVDALLL